ncbi:beta-ketoadipyl CoA thiolase [Acetobacter indonesiensis NRIC 0313]|uniref:Acetyl-CoA acetyltransferase n=1 Tax=Acetobacter indonesiensis TaxID=104101 RepID=A0A6N3T9C4_9PROT|nr:3-oxoadipyl-CoA thiolase [Acetobacter indonesiensis]GAN64492.1 acetyl-CoA acetyltransferase [Acetobacter indonesiensis]GBQ55286.1 beta-ketoadipyl CoA thiolase [Acetobacter indonesiensis NRIC 0313]GEN04209.1 acetyl-CoA acetyltransferase [Acetobacter indonesiensis]
MRDAYICDYTRTPIGRYAGALSSIRADDLATIPLKTLKERNTSVDWDQIDDCIMGCANQAGEDNRNIARMAVLLAGFPLSTPGTTINRLCGSGLDAVGQAARSISCGEADLMLAGGVESMSRAPFVLGKTTDAFAREATLQDTTIGWRFINPVMRETFGVETMPETAENISDMFNISRQDQDIFSYRSQQKTAKAKETGYFNREITPVSVKTRKLETTVTEDEHPRPETTLDGLAKLKTPFRAGGTVTAGNASGVNDGAAALLLASEDGAKRHSLTPIGRVVSMACAGVAPGIMGIGPVPAVHKLLARTGLTLDDIDLIELNEAFASQSLAVLRQLGLEDDCERVNPHGGAIALGHPLGMSGARLALTALNGLEARGGRRALVTMCIGVGQGIAAIIERV